MLFLVFGKMPAFLGASSGGLFSILGWGREVKWVTVNGLEKIGKSEFHLSRQDLKNLTSSPRTSFTYKHRKWAIYYNKAQT